MLAFEVSECSFYILFEIWPLKLIKFWSRAVIYSKIRCMCVYLRLFIHIYKLWMCDKWKNSDQKGDKTDMNSQQGGFYDKKNMTANVVFLCFLCGCLMHVYNSNNITYSLLCRHLFNEGCSHCSKYGTILRNYTSEYVMLLTRPRCLYLSHSHISFENSWKLNKRT